jgi:hypothetical protein
MCLQIIAQRLKESKWGTPHFYLSAGESWFARNIVVAQIMLLEHRQEVNRGAVVNPCVKDEKRITKVADAPCSNHYPKNSS